MNKKNYYKLSYIGMISVFIFMFLIMFEYKNNTDKKVVKEELKKVSLNYANSDNLNKTYMVDVSDIVYNVMPSIVAITSKTLVNNGQYSFNYDEYMTGAGSGIIVNEYNNELLILTNYHVIKDTKELTVTFIDNKSVDAQVKGYYKSRDIAIISINKKNIDKNTLDSIKVATIGDSKKLKVGEGVIAIGNALGYGQSVTTGVVSAINREVQINDIKTSMIQTDAAINGGNSGGALINGKGELIGINSLKYSSSNNLQASIEGMGFAIPITDVSSLIEKLMNKNVTDKDKGYLGITGYQISEEISKKYKLPKGFYIEESKNNKLEVGNIIIKVDNVDITSYEILSDILSDKKVGEELEIILSYKDNNQYKNKKVNVALIQ